MFIKYFVVIKFFNFLIVVKIFAFCLVFIGRNMDSFGE